ncbi:MAG: hypothetical protein LBQ18_02610 [Campylobacteraceae bacterium]|jgi:hypothetical protein|nr:hypothetical protein [Campylobacteraceae bacterium]
MENEFDTLSAKLDSIKSSIAEIENFTHKQSELFEVLSRRFPNIEQFTNALKEAHELQDSAKRLGADSENAAQIIHDLPIKLNVQKAALKEKSDIRQALIEILGKIESMDENMVGNLKKLISDVK